MNYLLPNEFTASLNIVPRGIFQGADGGHLITDGFQGVVEDVELDSSRFDLELASFETIEIACDLPDELGADRDEGYGESRCLHVVFIGNEGNDEDTGEGTTLEMLVTRTAKRRNRHQPPQMRGFVVRQELCHPSEGRWLHFEAVAT